MNIVQELVEIAKSKSLAEIRDFIKTNWDKFPQDIQDTLAVGMMTDAIQEKILGIAAAE